jgi:hypothetical protein
MVSTLTKGVRLRSTRLPAVTVSLRASIAEPAIANPLYGSRRGSWPLGAKPMGRPRQSGAMTTLLPARRCNQ